MTISSRAIAVLLATAAVAAFPTAASAQAQPAPAQGEAPAPQIKPSEKALPAIIALQTAVNNKDVANIPTKIAEAQALAKTKQDRYLIAQLQLRAALDAGDVATMSSAIDAMAASGLLEAAKASQLYAGLGAQFYNKKQFDQAASLFERALATNPQNLEPLTMIAETRLAQGRKAEAVAAFQRAIQASVAAGQKPKEGLYKRAVGAAYDARLPSAAEVARQWVAAYPSPESWRNAIGIYRNINKPDVEGTLALLRLMKAVGALTLPADYSLYATAAAEQLNFNEAQAIIDAGLAAKVVDPSNALFRDIINGLKAKRKATAADLAEATKTAQSAMSLLRIGDRYFGMGDYAKAVDLYRKAQGRGVDANLANLHIGMALAQSGDKSGAATALNAVTGQYAEIAKYWLLYAQS